MLEKLFGPDTPEERRLFLRVGLPGLILFLVGGAIAIAGDRTKTLTFMYVGFPMLGLGFLAWAVVGLLTYKANPAFREWAKAREKDPTVNKFNAAVCSGLVFFGIGLVVAEPTPFSVVFVVGAVGILVFFVRRGWPDRWTGSGE